MKQALAAMMFVSMVLTAAVSVRVVGSQIYDDRPLDKKIVAWDAGPDKIDVSAYTPEMKRKYKVFASLCGGRCHPLSRAINCDFALEDDWERYIKRMMRRAGTKIISPPDALAVFEFAVYDSKIRKKELYDYKLAASRQ
ncbi:MAG TPA: hypothetical protein VK886_05600 [Vicinamibacterales bacterium]|nr:hypothetical protein [Vicinamibacterales bacterium]